MASPSPSSRAAEAPEVDPRPIAIGDGGNAVLLLHGLTGTPYEVRSIAEALAEQGFAVRAPLLAGHTDLGALEGSTWRDWYASASAAFDTLWDDGRRHVVVLGFSMGALLALRLTALRPNDVAGTIAMSVPLQMPGWQRRAIVALARLRHNRLLGRVVGVLHKGDGPDIRVQREVESSPGLAAFPFPTLAEFVALQDEVSELLPHVRAPLMVIHGRLDHMAPVEGSEIVAQRVSSPRVERIVLPRSFHAVGLDLDRARACAEVVRFSRSVLEKKCLSSS